MYHLIPEEVNLSVILKNINVSIRFKKLISIKFVNLMYKILILKSEHFYKESVHRFLKNSLSLINQEIKCNSIAV